MTKDLHETVINKGPSLDRREEIEVSSEKDATVASEAITGVEMNPYVHNNKHGQPTDGMMCLCTMEDITVESGNYVEYQCWPSLKWKPALFEAHVIQTLLDTQFEQYVNKVKKADCQAELRRLLAPPGPPIYISDNHGLPLDEGDEYVIQLWFASTNTEVSALLKGALVGQEREDLWEQLKLYDVGSSSTGADDSDESGKEFKEDSIVDISEKDIRTVQDIDDGNIQR